MSRDQRKDGIIAGLRSEFNKQIQEFIERRGVDRAASYKVDPAAPGAAPVFLVTGATFTPYDPDLHGSDDPHAFHTLADGRRYLMNNTAAGLIRLLDQGQRVIVHSGNPALARQLADMHPNGGNATVIGGALSDPAINGDISRALALAAAEKPISDVRLMLYQSFAQSNGAPFKPLHVEELAEVERAANNRLRFAMNMAALSYDLLVNRGQEDLRVVSMSALAGQRATYGLLADAADKYANELFWKTFHIEANASTGKPVSVYMVNPGITTACDVYRRDQVRDLVERESIADGFPFDDEVFDRTKPLPQISSRDVSWVAEALLTAPWDADPNAAMPDTVKELLYGGFTPEELKEKFRQALTIGDDKIEMGPPGLLPEHLYAAATTYGKLPDAVKKGDFRRISLTPPGQRF